MEVVDIIKTSLAPLIIISYHSQWSNGARKLTIVYDSQARAEEYSGQSMRVPTSLELMTEKLSD